MTNKTFEITRIIAKDTSNGYDEVLLCEDSVSDIHTTYFVMVNEKVVFESKNAERAETRWYNIVMRRF